MSHEDPSSGLAVGLGSVTADHWSTLAGSVVVAGRDVGAALRLAADGGFDVPLPGGGATLERWAALATLGAIDLSLARVWEPHLDALAILEEAERGDLAVDGTTWGVFAAEAPGARLAAALEAPHATWRLDGIKPWCSLADDLTHALVTAWVDDERRGLFAVGLRAPSARGVPEDWVPHGLRNVRSAAVAFTAARAEPVGDTGWYLRREGFAWGGIGVAAVWYGGVVGVIRRMQHQARTRSLDQVGQLHLGRADAALCAARAVLIDSAELIDAGRAGGEAGARLALRVRQVVHDAAETVLREADHALGPAPLVHEAAYADRVADLRIYLRQHHGDRDAAALGRSLVEHPTW